MVKASRQYKGVHSHQAPFHAMQRGRDIKHACSGELQTLDVPPELPPRKVAQGAHPTFRAH